MAYLVKYIMKYTHFMHISTTVYILQYVCTVHVCGYLRVIEPTHSHRFSDAVLYPLSYQAPGSMVVRRKGIQVLVFCAHYTKQLLLWNIPG